MVCAGCVGDGLSGGKDLLWVRSCLMNVNGRSVKR